MNGPVVLRYFPIAGRAQALRHALHEAGVAFEDVRVSGAEWGERQNDPGFAGPFVGLPTLTWGADTIGETLAIAAFLGRRLGHYDGLDDAAIARVESIVSNCYLEVLGAFVTLFWADRLYPGCDLAQTFPRHLTRVLEKLARVEAMAPEGAGWLLPGRDRPSCADFFTGEAVEALRYVLGGPREPAVRARLPRLSALADRLRHLPALAPAWSNRPATFTWPRAEAPILEQLRAL